MGSSRRSAAHPHPTHRPPFPSYILRSPSDRGTDGPPPYLFCSPSVQPQCANLRIPSLPSPEPRADRFCALASFERRVSNGDAVKRAQFPCPSKDCAWGAIGLFPGRRLTRTGDLDLVSSRHRDLFPRRQTVGMLDYYLSS